MATEITVTEQTVEVTPVEFSPQINPSQTVVTLNVNNENTVVGVQQNAVISADLTPTTVKTANYSAALGQLVRADTTSGSFTVTLPDASGGDGKRVGIALVAGSNQLIVASTSGQTIAGLTPSNFNLLVAGETLYVTSDGANWLLGD